MSNISNLPNGYESVEEVSSCRVVVYEGEELAFDGHIEGVDSVDVMMVVGMGPIPYHIIDINKPIPTYGSIPNSRMFYFYQNGHLIISTRIRWIKWVKDEIANCSEPNALFVLKNVARIFSTIGFC